MSKAKRLLGLLATLGLTTLALSALTTTPASALQEPTALKVCKKVPASLKERGLWKSTEECATTKYETKGEYAWSWPENKGTETVYCLLGGTKFTEAICGLGGPSPFEEAKVVEAFPKVEGTILLSLLKSKIAGLTSTIACKSGSFEAQPLTPTLVSGALIRYTECSLSAPPNCGIKSVGVEPTGKVTTLGLDGKLLSLTSIAFVPESTGSRFVELELTGASCSANKSLLPIKGEQTCRIGGPVSSSTPALLHLIECLPSGSKLKLGEEKSTYEGTAHVRIAGNLSWKIL